jgi:glycine/D-amino acid oxidase-like deaminating enzyme
MGIVLKRVARDMSTPPALYGAAGLEPPVRGTTSWSERVDVAIIGGGVTGLWTAYQLAAQGTRVVLLEARQIGHGASGRAFGQLVPFLKHSHRKIVADFGAEHGQRLSDAVAAAPTNISAFLEQHQIACAATRSGILFGARTDAGRRSLEETAATQQGTRMVYGADAADIVGSNYYHAVYLDSRGFHLDPLAYTRGLARVALAQGALLYPETRVDKIGPHGSQWDIRSGDRRLIAETVAIATNAYSGALWPTLARSTVPFLVHGAVTEPLPDETLARILPQGQPLTDTRRLYSGVRKFAGRLHVSVDGASFRPRAADAQEGIRKRLAELYPWMPTPRVSESWSGWVALTVDQYPRIHQLAKGVWAGLGCNGRGLAVASILGRDLAHLARGGDARATAFPVTPLRPFPLHDAAAGVVAATVSAKRWLDRVDTMRNQ